MRLVDYSSRQSNQKAKVTNKYDEVFAVATIARIRDAIAAIYINTTPQNCQSQHFNSVDHTFHTCLNSPPNKLFSALNLCTNQLLHSHSANAAQTQPSKNSDLSNSNAVQQTPPTTATSRVIFQSTPNSEINSTRSSNEGPASPNLEL